MLNIAQIQELLNIIEKNHLVFIGQTLGLNFLSRDDRKRLNRWGVDWQNLFDPSADPIEKIFHLGMLSDSLKGFNARKFKYNELEEYIKKGQYIPLTEREKAVIAAIKQQTYTDIKNLEGNIFKDVNYILQDKTLEGQQKFLKEEVLKGKIEFKQAKEIASDIAHKTGDWNRNFELIVNCNLSNAYNKGVQEMALRNQGPDALVYKVVQETACESCIKAYLTNGKGSEPIIFKLSDLAANGSNIGRKKADWLPTVDILHPNCFCKLREKPKGFTYNPETKIFNAPDPEYVPKVKREKIRVWISGKETWI